ncbi:MAG: hypothetical protein LIP01_04615 [Tannerellaceae bacterium]|nr:hypothetical protein [Tannerellaceae bacterium]
MEYDLSGKWYILYSNFPMWLKGNKKNPSFYYGTPENGRFSDTVEYEQNDTIKKIQGTDSIQGTKFIWRGKGLLRFVKSQWEILYFNPKDGIAIIHFDKTLFTPEGYDVISREKTIHPTIEKELFIQLYKLDIKDKLIKIQ